MRTKLLLAFIISALSLPLFATDPAPNGLTVETAVVISATNEKDGPPKEIGWIQENYPKSKILRFVTRPSKNQKVYDIFFIKTADGKKLQLYFEISSFYHKT